jgi:hypothetical protein
MIIFEILADLYRYLMENYTKYMRYLFISIGFGIIYLIMIFSMSLDKKIIYYTNFEDIVYTDENKITHVSKSGKELWNGLAKSVVKNKEFFIITTEKGEIKKFHFESLNPLHKNDFLYKQIEKVKNSN